MTVGENIKEWMANEGLTQTQFAYMIGASQKAVSNWINNVYLPSSDSLLAIYQKFGVTPNEILGIDDAKLHSWQRDSFDSLSQQEKILIKSFREQPMPKQHAILSLLDADIK